MTQSTERLSSALADRYQILDRLGEGGMATVYLAEDLKHDRKVAVKVLRPELAAVLGAERFVQEIKTTANLQHPHILPMFDSGEADSFLYYVMPYIEGETLRGKLDRETQFGIDEAVKIACEVADALDYAHRQGVIHRDIKPENILLHDGRPMVADFGIALAVSAAAGGRMTETGLSLGTPHYMSPEQATAEKDLTARADIYSLGTVLYEMLAGEPPHLGNSAQQIIMKIVTDEARPITDLRKSVPPHVAEAVAISLERLPADRFDSASSFAAALKGTVSTRRATTPQHAQSPAHGQRAWVGWIVGFVGVAVAIAAVVASRGPTNLTAASKHLNIVLPDSAPLTFIGEGTLGLGRPAIALTPDGETLVYAALVDGVDQLYRREMTDFTTTPIAGTEGAFHPFLSPDGEWVAFFVGAELRKVPVAGGAVVRLASTPESFGAEWSQDERILVAIREGGTLGWVPSSGGTIQAVRNPQGVFRQRPHILPGGRHALVQVWGSEFVFGTVIGVTDLESGRTMVLTAAGPVVPDSVDPSAVISGRQPRYLASGHLVYQTLSGLVAVAFDPERFTIEGTAVEVLSDVRRDGGAHYAVTADGTLFYAEGSNGLHGAFVWSAGGIIDSLGLEAQDYGTFDLSPDGRRLVALVSPAAGVAELWVYDLLRGSQSKVLTRGKPTNPRWWPDGRQIVFTEVSLEPPHTRVSVRQLVESGGERDTLGFDWALSGIAPDSSRAVGVLGGFGGGAWVFSLTGDAEPVPIDSFPTAWGPAFSTDGRWIAYTSNESGRYEVYTTAIDRLGERQQVSLAGGEEPVWSPVGDELIYRWGQEWFSLSVPRAGDSSFGRPRAISRGPFINTAYRSHDISPDGRRQLLILGPLEQTAGHLNVITNWLAEVTRKVGQ